MTHLVGGANPNGPSRLFPGIANLPAWYRNDMFTCEILDLAANYPPKSGLLGVETDGGTWIESNQFEAMDISVGTHTLYVITGSTRDASGGLLAGVSVKLFLTATDVLIDSTVSDVSGQFIVKSPYYPDGHYLVYYKAGSPDVHGASVNTLQAQPGQ
jgi:hypothetical protein